MNNEDEVIQNLLEKAESFENQGLRTEAIELLRQASTRHQDPIVLTRFGALATDLELWGEAEAALQTASRMEPHFAAPYFYLGLLYQAQSRLDEALGFLRKAVREDPSATNFTVMGVIQTQLDLMEEAKQSFRTAISLDAEYEEAYYNLGTITENNDEAILLLQKAIDVDSNYAAAHRELALRLRITDQFAEAEYHLRRAVELAPSDGWAHIYLGNLLWASGDLTSAEAAFNRALQVWPDRSVPFWCLAYFLERQDRSQEAQKLYQKALEIDPADAEANRRFGIYLKDLGDYKEAKGYLSRALCLNPDDKRAAEALSAIMGS